MSENILDASGPQTLGLSETGVARLSSVLRADITETSAGRGCIDLSPREDRIFRGSRTSEPGWAANAPR